MTARVRTRTRNFGRNSTASDRRPAKGPKRRRDRPCAASIGVITAFLPDFLRLQHKMEHNGTLSRPRRWPLSKGGGRRRATLYHKMPHILSACGPSRPATSSGCNRPPVAGVATTKSICKPRKLCILPSICEGPSNSPSRRKRPASGWKRSRYSRKGM
jgi:hypothetical protein